MRQRPEFINPLLNRCKLLLKFLKFGRRAGIPGTGRKTAYPSQEPRDLHRPPIERGELSRIKVRLRFCHRLSRLGYCLAEPPATLVEAIQLGDKPAL
jgi:hypothetical protein